MPRRAVDRAAAQVKSRAESFFDEEYELDRFQIEELEEELDTLELQILTSDTRSTVDGKQIQKKVNEVDRKVKKDIAVRMRRGVVISTGVLILLVYLMGYIPYMFNSLRNGGWGICGSTWHKSWSDVDCGNRRNRCLGSSQKADRGEYGAVQ